MALFSPRTGACQPQRHPLAARSSRCAAQTWISMPRKKAKARGDSVNRRAGNLGNLESLVSAGSSALQDSYVETWNSVDPSRLGPQVDGSAAFASLLLLVLLIGLGGNRILGLERFFTQFMRRWVEQRRYDARNQSIAAREQLERQFREESGGGAAE